MRSGRSRYARPQADVFSAPPARVRPNFGISAVRMSSFGKSALLGFALATLLAGCGVRGSLEAPSQAKAEGTATSPAAQGTAEDSAGPQKPHRPFILDGLLR